MGEEKKVENKKEKKAEGRKCFIITPIGEASSETFRMAKGVIESVIKPLLSDYGYDDIKPSYEINQTGMITTQIINRIIDDDLVIANLTGNNPNVMYELCLRHAAAKPIIHICQHGTNLPFDIKDNRTIFFENDMLGVQELKEQIDSFMQEIDYEEEYIDNPIYNGQRMGRLLKELPKESEEKIEIELLQNILKKISDLNSSANSNIEYKKVVLGDVFGEVMIGLENAISKNMADAIEEQLDTKLGKLGLIKNAVIIGSLYKKGIVTYLSMKKIPEKTISNVIFDISEKNDVKLAVRFKKFL